ncbi:hypothetical protein [Crossiella cryophila]|uniref:Uncharacterized protein n=1 Tax=Crossiella cryophila TaxID=43355 RepID=A0A7W7FWR2_9PSEU|nr:hypothetical protein [Crossiella cryophila]MBB4679868.1 hypothetical protein [Crossiella cryophila]
MAVLTTRGPAGDHGLARHTIGNATILCQPGKLSDEARALALTVAADSENLLVVVDLPEDSPIGLWDQVAKVLPRRRGIRLVIGGRNRETAALAGQWLSERLGRSVLAPDGALTRAAGGGLFVHSGPGTGWVRFRKGRVPVWEAKRFPKPTWENGSPLDAEPTSSRGVAEPIPGGIWIRPAGDDPRQAEQRVKLAETLPVRPDLMTVVVGSPGGAPLSLDDVSRLWIQLAEPVRRQTRFVHYGPLSFANNDTLGQALADLFGTGIVTYTGLPTGTGELRTVLPDGSAGWQPYATQLLHTARDSRGVALPPIVLAHRSPVGNLPEIGPAVYWTAPDAVIEVVPAGLVLRSPVPSPDVPALRDIRLDARQNNLIFDPAGESEPGRMRFLANDMFGRLDTASRESARVLAAAELLAEHGVRASGAANAVVTLRDPAPVAPVEQAPVQAEPYRPVGRTATEAPSILAALAPVVAVEPAAPQAQAVEAPARAAVEPVAAPATEAPAPVPPAPAVTAAPVIPAGPARALPTPAPAAAALIPDRGLTDEREWLRTNLGAEYGTLSNALARVLSEHPGFQGALTRSAAEILTDAVAVRLYLSPRGIAVDAGLRAATVGAHVPFARCVVSGLNRLPSHRGAAVFTATVDAERLEFYRDNAAVTEWGFLNALTGPHAGSAGDTDLVVWSMTARRTRLLEPEDSRVADRVLFVPGTSFKVLEVTGAAEGQRGRILLRELGAAEIDAEGRIDASRASLDELALRSLKQQLDRWATDQPADPIDAAAAARFGTLPGLV